MSLSENLKRTEKIQLMLGESELQAIDDWRFENRLPTRAAAIRELLRRGLLAAKQFDSPDKKASTHDFRVIDENPRSSRKTARKDPEALA